MEKPLLFTSYNVYTGLECLLMFLLFRQHVRRRKLITTTACLGMIACIAVPIMWGYSTRFYSELVCLTSLIYTSWILLVILEQYETDDDPVTQRQPFFWYLTGLLFYAPCTLLVFSLWPYLKQHPHAAVGALWTIHHIFNITMYVLFTIGLTRTTKSATTHSTSISRHAQ